jgi:hypothetical protein
MSTQLFIEASLFDYFRERVDEAQHDGGVALPADMALYLANLLSDRARTDRPAPDAHTLVELHAHAVGAAPAEQARVWRELGDRALYHLGYFTESLDRRLVGPDYYATMGAGAYRQVDQVFKRWFADAFGDLFADLSHRFADCASVLSAVRQVHERADPVNDLIEQWLNTGSEEAARKLRRRGIVIPRGPLPAT